MIFLLLKFILSILVSIIMMTYLLMLCGSALALDRFPDLVTAHSNLAVLTLSQGFGSFSLGTSLLRVKTRYILSGSRCFSRSLVWHILISFYFLRLLVRTSILFLVLMNDVSHSRGFQFFTWDRVSIWSRTSWGHFDRTRLRRIIVCSSFTATVSTWDLWEHLWQRLGTFISSSAK